MNIREFKRRVAENLTESAYIKRRDKEVKPIPRKRPSSDSIGENITQHYLTRNNTELSGGRHHCHLCHMRGKQNRKRIMVAPLLTGIPSRILYSIA